MRIGSITPCKYTPGELEYVSFIRGNAGWSNHQGPTLTQYSDGRLIMVWTAYDVHECNNDNVMLYAISENNGETWSEPEVYMAAPGANVSHAFQVQLRGTDKVVMVNREGFYVGAEVDPVTKRVLKWANYARSANRIIVRTSLDRGNTWNFGKELLYEQIVPNHQPPFYGAPQDLLQLQSGTLLMPVCFLPPDHRDPQHYDAAFLRSGDEGETWERTHILTVPEERGAMEPTIVELEPDTLYCVLRNKSGYLYETRSHDGGRSWSTPAKTRIPSPESISKLLKLGSGRVLLVWNNQSSTTQRPRYPLVCALSGDGCKSWSEPRIIATESGTNQLSNFDVAQLNDGRILLATSHYHAIPPPASDIDLALFDEEWVLNGGT
ncbi:MAG: exo-alpha-sialidase [Candidatus Latescibacteria bacterium]|nr:exo-alpha-sialidase [Candidatus Latescibacterota bacterium]